MPSLHLQNSGALVAQRIESLNQSLRHQLLLAIEILTDVLELVDAVKLHGCHVRGVENVLQDLSKATSFLELVQSLISLELLSLLAILFLLLGVGADLLFAQVLLVLLLILIGNFIIARP